MSMNEQTSEPGRPRSRWRKVLWILAGIFVVPPALIFLILIIMIQVNRVRPDQMQPPPGMMKSFNARADRTTSGTLASTQSPTNFEDVLAAHPNPELARIYKKLGESGWDKSPFTKWVTDQPLTTEQIQWLKNNQGMINNLMKLAKLGSGPIMTYEEACAIDPFARMQLPLPNFFEHLTFARILTAEAIRRMNSGDKQGAADALMSVHPIAQLIREPMLISYLNARQMQSIANQQLACWINEGKLSPEIARRLRDSLPTQAIAGDDLRKSIESECRWQRDMMMQIVSGSITETWRLAWPDHGKNEDFMDHVSDQMHKDPLATGGKLAALTGFSLVWKADGSRMVQRFDSAYQSIFNDVDNNRSIQSYDDNIDVFHMVRFPNYNEVRTRAITNTALLNLDVAGLDLIAGGDGGGTDPFNNQPLKSISEPESTLFYSLGPDLKDQRGAVTYDPTNGATSAGDICVRVKKKPR